MKPILLIGDIVVDVTLKSVTTPIKLRMGGILHACRGSWSLGRDYVVGYFAPEYLEKSIQAILENLNCHSNTKMGNILGAPYVFLIHDAKEAGDQGYEFLLRNEIEVRYTPDPPKWNVEDVLIISGNYDLGTALKTLDSNVKIHIDVANNVRDFELLQKMSRKLTTIFVSTSSILFKEYFRGDFDSFADLFRPFTECLILKENRGGSRAINFTTKETVLISSQTQPISHSVGVGDVYNLCYVNFYRAHSATEALTLASWIASEYAATTFPDDFKKEVTRLLSIEINELIEIQGVSLPWEQRKTISIYIAGPDFDYIDTSPIDLVESNLQYHNFTTHRPIKENGQMETNADSSRKKELFDKDMLLLENCNIIVAVLLNNDPGTLVEIGLGEGLGIPVIVYDPYNIGRNCMLTELPKLVTNDLDKVVSEVFIQSVKHD